jgi:hypothetical protein
MKVIKPNTIAYPDGSFSRGTIGTYFNKTGVMQTAAIDEPRFTYNPTTLKFEGLLLEPAIYNLLLYSEDFTNANWVKTGTTVTSNTTVAPDGTTTADTITATNIDIRQSLGTPLAGNLTFSIYLKGSGTVYIRLQGANISPTAAQTVVLTSNWVRYSVSLEFLTYYGNVLADIINLDSSSPVVYAWGAQLELSSVATSYIKTTAAQTLRNTDVVTGTGLIYTTATDPNPVYSSGTTYAVNAIVRYNSMLYQSLQSANINHQPDTSSTWWIELYSDNMHAAFDNQTSTATSGTTSITFVVKAGSFDTTALINLEASLAELAVSDYASKTLIYSNSIGLAEGTIQDWYQYFFNDPLVHRTQAVFYGVPPYTEAVATLRLTGSTGDIVSVAQAIFGTVAELGGTQYGAQAGITDYSVKETDAFGTTTFTKRAFSKRLTADLYLTTAELNRVQNFLYNIRATPTVWIASDDPLLEEASVIWGFYRDFSTSISYPSHALCNIQIEGLT